MRLTVKCDSVLAGLRKMKQSASNIFHMRHNGPSHWTTCWQWVIIWYAGRKIFQTRDTYLHSLQMNHTDWMGPVGLNHYKGA